MAAIIGGAATLLVFGPIAFAVLMMRCCESSRDASGGAWVVVGVVLLVAALAAAAMTGLIAAGVRRLLFGSRTSS